MQVVKDVIYAEWGNWTQIAKRLSEVSLATLSIVSMYLFTSITALSFYVHKKTLGKCMSTPVRKQSKTRYSLVTLALQSMCLAPWENHAVGPWASIMVPAIPAALTQLMSKPSTSMPIREASQFVSPDTPAANVAAFGPPQDIDTSAEDPDNNEGLIIEGEAIYPTSNDEPTETEDQTPSQLPSEVGEPYTFVSEQEAQAQFEAASGRKRSPIPNFILQLVNLMRMPR